MLQNYPSRRERAKIQFISWHSSYTIEGKLKKKNKKKQKSKKERKLSHVDYAEEMGSGGVRLHCKREVPCLIPSHLNGLKLVKYNTRYLVYFHPTWWGEPNWIWLGSIMFEFIPTSFFSSKVFKVSMTTFSSLNYLASNLNYFMQN